MDKKAKEIINLMVKKELRKIDQQKFIAWNLLLGLLLLIFICKHYGL